MEVFFKVTGIEELKATLTKAAQRQFPYIMAKALTNTAQVVKNHEVREMLSVFDRPTPYTLNALYVKPATKEKLEAQVWFKDEWSMGSSGTPAAKFLFPEIFGGDRNAKKHEKALRSIGILPGNMYCVPGKFADLDMYGNMKASQIIQILSYFRAFNVAGYKANITDKRKSKIKTGTKKTRGYEYFTVRGFEKSNLHPGIYKRIGFAWGSSIKPIMMFVKEPRYKKRFDFFGVANRVSDWIFMDRFTRAMREALKI